jgi:hypothetical protein
VSSFTGEECPSESFSIRANQGTRAVSPEEASMNLALIRSKADFIGSLNPKASDAVHPHIPFAFSNAHVELMVADVVKHVAARLSDHGLSKKGLELSKKMATDATASLVNAWEPGDELCPPWRGPWPVPHREFETPGPQPEPWQPVDSATQIELAQVLNHLSGLTSSVESNAALKGLATGVARGAASKLADDFERCGTKPREPFPRPRR